MIANRIASSFARPRRFILIAAFSLAAFSLAGIASAEAMDVTAEQRAACTPDAMRLCSSEIPDIGRVTACMKANRASLSARCQASFASAAPSQGALPRRERVIVTSHVAANGRIIRHHGYAAGPAYSYRHHGHGYGGQGYGGQGQSAQAMAIMRQVVGGLATACGTGSLPPEVCSMSGSMGGTGGLAGLAGLGNAGGNMDGSPY